MSTVTTIIAAPVAITRVFAAGQRGPAGPAGPQGEQGPPGDAEGIPGLSAYEVAVADGFVGDETAWLASLVGATGADGASAYEVAVADGFVGDETAWLASLVGATGADGASAYEVAVADGFVGDETAWLASLVGATGADGASAYEVAVADGFVGDETAWLASLVGPAGADGANATIAGSNTQIQFNDGGALGADAGLTYDKATGTLSATQTKTASVAGPDSVTGTQLRAGAGGTLSTLGIDPSATAPYFVTGGSVYDVLHSGNTKTINGNSIVGSGNITITSGASTAEDISYDNATSGLTATDVQGAIDELNTVAGALASIRGTAWRSFDWANATFYTRTAFGSGFNTLNQYTRYATIECSASVANSGGYISGNHSVPVGNIAVLGPWANNWTGIMVFLPYQGANDVSTTAGLQDSSSGTATASLFGVEYSLANGWEIVFRYSSTDLKTRVPFTMAAAENMILEVYYETDAAQTVVELIRVTVRDYPSGSVIATDTWTGSTVFNSLYWKLKAYKVGASSLREFLYSVLYIGDGFNPPPGLSFG